MKYISNNEADGVLERLLRAEIGRASRNGAPCAQFDPDFSTAYIERNLTPGEIGRYEVHLAACPNCRIQVAKLARLGYAEIPVEAAREIVSSSEISGRARNKEMGFSRAFAYLLQPQWIAIGTAALLLLVALPVFFILKNSRPNPRSVISDATSAGTLEPAPPVVDREESNGNLQRGYLTQGQSGVSSGSASKDSVPSDNKSLASGSSSAGPAPPAAVSAGDNSLVDAIPSGTVAGPSGAAPQKTAAGEAGKQSEGTQVAESNPQPSRQQDHEQQRNQTKSKVEVTAMTGEVREKQQSPAPPSQVVADQYNAAAKKVEQPASSEQISSKQAQTLPEDDKRSGVSVLRQRDIGTDATRAKEGYATIRPKDSEPPKTKSESNREETERRIAKKGPSKEPTGGAGRGDVDTVHKPATQQLTKGQKVEKRVDTKRFRMQAGVWTDRDFKPAKEIPAVTLIRDTEVYKSALEKQPGLKTFLAGFGPDERVIVVYKGIVYKILPSKN